jgi:hypothetical protein
MEEAIPRILDHPAHRLTMIDEVSSRRIARWPIVNIIYTALAPLFSFYRVSAVPAVASPHALLESHLFIQGQPLAAAIATTFAYLHGAHPQLGNLYQTDKLWEDHPARAAAAELTDSIAATLGRQELAARTKIAGRGVLFAPIRWLLTIGVLLWFPFIQPALQIFLQPGPVPTLKSAALLLVQILGVTYLLQSAAFLIIWFACLCLALRWNTARRVDRLLRRLRSAAAPDPSLSLAAATISWCDELLDPIKDARERTQSLIARADAHRGKLALSAAA